MPKMLMPVSYMDMCLCSVFFSSGCKKQCDQRCLQVPLDSILTAVDADTDAAASCLLLVLLVHR